MEPRETRWKLAQMGVSVVGGVADQPDGSVGFAPAETLFGAAGVEGAETDARKMVRSYDPSVGVGRLALYAIVSAISSQTDRRSASLMLPAMLSANSVAICCFNSASVLTAIT